VTAFGIFFTPVFYSVIRKFAERGAESSDDSAPHVSVEATNGASDGQPVNTTLPQATH
jgi:hypothetical protein